PSGRPAEAPVRGAAVAPRPIRAAAVPRRRSAGARTAARLRGRSVVRDRGTGADRAGTRAAVPRTGRAGRLRRAREEREGPRRADAGGGESGEREAGAHRAPASACPRGRSALRRIAVSFPDRDAALLQVLSNLAETC